MLPGGESEGFAFDLGGNLVYQTNYNGMVITNQYDELNRLTNQISVNGYQVSHVYDPATGQRVRMTDGSGVTAYGYDRRDRLVLKTVNWNQGPGVSLNYGYDADGNVTNLWSSTAGGVNLAYCYDPLNRLTNVVGQPSRLAEYAYDAVGNLQTAGYGNGVTNQYQYDALNRLTNQTASGVSGTIARFYYQLGLTGNQTNLSEMVNDIGRTYAWKYDALNRLTNETISALGSVGYGYDAVGNRTNRASGISSLASGSSSYTANDWLTSDQYDANGNTTNSASVAYRYDVLNRLVDYNHGAVTLDYNGDGQRVVKNVGGQVTYYVVDDRNPSGYAQVVEEITAYARTTNLTKVYAYGLDLISQQQPGVATNYYGHDGHGSVRYLTSTSGDITDTYTYDAYGNLIASIGSTANNYLYCGEQYDPQLKFYYNRARYLNPDTGRFWTTDTFAGSNEDPLSLHKYLYCQNDPVNGVDPSGKAVYFVERQFNSSLKYLWVDNIGHGYLLFTSTSDPGTDDPFESHQTIIDSFSYHPFRWNFDGSQAPSRVWENDTENDWNPGWHDALLVTTDATQQQALLKCVNNWITGGNSGYERGAPIEDHYTGYQGNTVGSLEHIRPPDDAVYYSTFGQNCVWWATVMLKQSNISVYPLVYQAIEEYNDGVSAATQVILGSRSCYKANRVTPMPKLFIPDIPMDDLYGSVL